MLPLIRVLFSFFTLGVGVLSAVRKGKREASLVTEWFLLTPLRTKGAQEDSPTWSPRQQRSKALKVGLSV